MFLNQFCQQNGNKISFTRQQACAFAKQIADDFNPLHDVDAKRFCVPGDLLFSLVLAKSGLRQNMRFIFSGMVTEDIDLLFPEHIDQSAKIVDDNNKEYLCIDADGDKSTNEALIESLVRSYVAFSGHTFPGLLVELMQKENVMINPARPMVMYENMDIHIDRVDLEAVELVPTDAELNVEGKRGKAILSFDLVANGEKVGHGKKQMLLSGLRPYCNNTIEAIVEEYIAHKARYKASLEK